MTDLVIGFDPEKDLDFLEAMSIVHEHSAVEPYMLKAKSRKGDMLGWIFETKDYKYHMVLWDNKLRKVRFSATLDDLDFNPLVFSLFRQIHNDQTYDQSI